MTNMPDELRQGYLRFRKQCRAPANGNELSCVAAAGPRLPPRPAPTTMIIACAECHVDPATIFSAPASDFFVVRNVAALVPPHEEDGRYHGTSAALEYAVTGLEVSHIVVMGHAQCGGISAALAAAEDQPVGRFIGPWVDLLSQVREELIDRIEPSHVELRQEALERMSIQQSLENLLTFPFIAERVMDGRLTLNGAWCSNSHGDLQWLDWDSGVFERLETRLVWAS